MKFSIIICTYNRAGQLEIVLDQLQSQAAVINDQVEILIVDNNSTDQTRSVAGTFIAKNKGLFRYIFESQSGKSFALNTAIKQAKGDWFFFTDDDVRFDGHWLKNMIKAAGMYPVKCFFARIIPLWESDKPVWFDQKIGSVIVNADHGDVYKVNMNYLVGANMAIHRDVFNLVGGFNETIKRFEDSEFSLRLKKNKVDMAYVPDAIVYHPVARSRLSKTYFRKWYFEMGRIIDLRLLDVQDKKIFGFPRWVYREFITQIFLYLKSFDPKARFYHQLQIFRLLGSFQQKWFYTGL